ncbi:hypothetical protein [Sphingomonas pokkalii]|uniref:Uncharacterized protein n=1 Tax=Sphingomonas pokkalii TaxID=2175090 RepID=A0A2U0SA70_9SPHN|nr:hypothetical protein [Sphingomonas pokkalii]PVX28219.1 hypothetical protein DD559_01735 [Sphingomonas pokkalii]
MKLLVAGAIAAAMFSPAAMAQQAAAPAAATAPASAGGPASARFSVDTPIVDLFANADAKAVLVANGLGDLEAHPAYEQFKAMSFRAVAPFSQGKITDEMLAKLDADLAKVK